MSIKIGEVIAVKGVTVTIKMSEESNKETLFYGGEKFKGVSIREYILIQRGFIDIVCVVEGEFLDESRVEVEGNKFSYIRRVEVKPIGYFRENEFSEGIKFLPMIEDSAYLISENQVNKIFSKQNDNDFIIGKMLKEELPVSINWKNLFNTHLGIFGNTGSGKSNTLAKLYTTLFSSKTHEIRDKSQFILIDFNGEYTGDQLIDAENKSVLILDTKNGQQTFPLTDEEFWDVEILSILFQATANTQKPFLNRVINGRKKFLTAPASLTNYTKSIFEKVFTAAAPKPECLDLVRTISGILGDQNLLAKLREIVWHAKNGQFKHGSTGTIFYDANGTNYASILKPLVDQINVSVDPFQELELRANLQLCSDLLRGFVQFDHIQPLLKRIDSSVTSLKKVLSVTTAIQPKKILTVISLRKCKQDVKKVLPLLIAKHYYNEHKELVESPPDKTVHLIIDEAHNILSEQSARESESWKDYRLELFEEIIKEGRKFGMFITLASQRPADISPTIVSQLHNFFIHRLVNDKDLQLLDNTISTLDRVSKSLIPSLPRGACVITGTSFTLPMLVQVDLLESEMKPFSDDVDLGSLWSH